MFFGLAHTAATRECRQQLLVDAQMNGATCCHCSRDLGARLRPTHARRVARRRSSTSAQAAPERSAMRRTAGCGCDIESFEKVTGKQLPDSCRCRSTGSDSMPSSAARNTSSASTRQSRKIELNGAFCREHAAALRLVDHARRSCCSTSATRCADRRHFPQQLAQRAARDRTQRRREVCEQRPHLARRRQRHLDAPPPRETVSCRASARGPKMPI